ALLDHLANELHAEPLPAVRREDVDVREIDERDAVRERAREAELALAVVDADDALRLVDQPRDDGEWPPFRPVRVVGEEVVNGCDCVSARIVVDLDGHQALRSVRSRKLPKYSYADVITASASRAARSFMPTAGASASGRASKDSMPLMPAGESASASARPPAQPAPPAAAE